MVQRKPVLRFLGVRGSLPTPGPSTVRVGGNTACVELRAGADRLVFDAGTGLRQLGAELAGEPDLHLALLISHYHWDHLLGLPFFAPIFQKSTHLEFYGEAKEDGGPKEALLREFASPHFPVLFSMLPARMDFHAVAPGDCFSVGKVDVRVGRLNHPQGALCYRAQVGRKVVVYASDHEHGTDVDQGLLELARGADVLVYDAAYTDEVYQASKRGWGHSTWQEAAKVAQAAGVKQLYLFHHDPSHDDKTLARIERDLKKRFAGGAVAREGLEVEL